MQSLLFAVDDATISICDLNTGLLHAHLRPCKTEKNAVACNLIDGTFVAAQSDKAILNIWSMQKEQPLHKIICAEKLCALAWSSRGDFLAAATEKGRLFIWDWASGDLLRTFDAHFKKVTKLCFTADDRYLLSAGEDAVVYCWSVDRVISESLPVKSMFTWADHTLPVTDIVCGVTSAGALRVITVSMDRTCKLWDLPSGRLLCTFLLPAACTCVAWHRDETAIFVGTATGSIYQIQLYEPFPSVQLNLAEHESMNTDTTSGFYKDIVNVEEQQSTKIFSTGEECSIESTIISMDGTKLITGSDRGQVTIWDMTSRQPLRTLSSFKGSIRNLWMSMTVRSDESSRVYYTPLYPQNLSRMPVLLDNGMNTDAASRWIKLYVTPKNDETASHRAVSDSQNQMSTISGGSAETAQELEQTKQHLQFMQEQYQRLKELNEEMYQELSKRL